MGITELRQLPRRWARRIRQAGTAQKAELCVIALLLVLTPVSITRIAQLALRDTGSWDFFTYWRAGWVVWHGETPYAESSRIVQPSVLVMVFDGVPSEVIEHMGGNFAVQLPNTPLILAYTIPFSLLLWPAAKTLWLVNNLIVMALIPLLIAKTPLISGFRIGWPDHLLSALFFYNMLATKLAIEAGQITILVFGLIVAALAFANKSKWLAGVLLGVALSKYTLSMPVAIYFLLKRELRILIFAAAIQVAGFVVLGILAHSSPWVVLGQYFRLVHGAYFNNPAVRWGHTIHLATLFKAEGPFAIIATVLVTAIVFGMILRWLYFVAKIQAAYRSSVDSHLVTVIAIWSLLVVYHGNYDAVLYILFFALVLVGWRYPSVWNLNKWQSRALAFVVGFLAFSATSVYTRTVYLLFPNAPDITPRTMTFSLIVMLVVTLWLAHRAVTQTYSMQTSS